MLIVIAQWPHNTGPVVTYMAECTGTTDCTTFDPTNAQWFKIDQIGEESAGKWYQAVFSAFRFPSNVAIY